jgi:hypothetical protein
MVRFSTPHDDLSRIACLTCEIGLDLHQPDSGSPDRLLGICAGCQQWFILDLLPDADEAVLVLVPESRDFLKIGGPLDGQHRR